jgi:ROK family
MTRRPDDPRRTEDVIADMVRELMASHDVEAVGGLLFAPNLAWREEPLRAAIEDRCGLPVVIENDANAAAWRRRARCRTWRGPCGDPHHRHRARRRIVHDEPAWHAFLQHLTARGHRPTPNCSSPSSALRPASWAPPTSPLPRVTMDLLW